MDQGNESDCSSDDIPDLESVASSEYYEESDGGAEPQDTEKLFVPPPAVKSYMSSENYEPADKWLCYVRESGTINDSMEALKALTCSPIVFGGHVDASHWKEHWLPWFQETKLLSNSKGNLGTLSMDEIRIVDIIDNTYEWMWKKIQANVELKYLVFIMDVWDIIEKERVLSSAIGFARSKVWFSDLLKDILCLPESLGLKDGIFRQGSHALALCCLYCCCYAGFKIREIIKSEGNLVKDFHSLQFSRDEGKRLIKSYLVQSEMAYHSLEEYEEKYIETMRLWPFSISVHESRSMCHLSTMQQWGLISDLYRVVTLKNDHKMALLYLVKMFRDLQDSVREEMFAKKYETFYPTTEDQIVLEKHLETVLDKPIMNTEPTMDEIDHFHLLEEMSAKGSDELLQENYEAALQYYKKVLKGTETKMGWHFSIPWDRVTTWILSLKFSCAWASFKMSAYDVALDEFLILKKANRCYPFAAAYLYTATCYMKLKRFREATDTVKAGLQSLNCKHRRVDPIYWPGTRTVISECNQQHVKTKLLQMRAQLIPDSDTIATCPHPSCLQHNITKQIIRDDPDFKGYTLLHCTEKCSVGYHPSCWRKFKVAQPEITSEKGFLSSPCITPDCPGIINYIAVFELADKPKFEVHLEEAKTNLLQEDDSKCSQQTKWKKKSSQEGRKGSTSTHHIAPPPSQGEKTAEEKEEDPSVMSQEEEPAKQKKETLLTEDSRKVEDSVVVINKLAEDEVKEEDKTKVTKKKKKKKTKGKKEPEESQKDNHCQWEDIFTLPERQGLVGDSPEEERKYFTIDGDVLSQTYKDQQPPPTSIGKFPSEEQTSSQESSESSNSTYSRSSSSVLDGLSSDRDWLLSYFVEVFKQHGPMHPMDHQLVESVQLLPDENQKFIESCGGIGEFLMASPLFRTYLSGAKIGLKQDRAIIAETLETTHGTNHIDTRPNPLPRSSSYGSDMHVSKRKEKRTISSSWNSLPPDNTGPKKNTLIPPPDGAGIRKTLDITGPKRSHSLSAESTGHTKTDIPIDNTGAKKTVLPPDNTRLKKTVLTTDSSGPQKTVLPTDNTGPKKTVLPTENTGPKKTVLPTDNTETKRTSSSHDDGRVEKKKVVEEMSTKKGSTGSNVTASAPVGSVTAGGNLERSKKEIATSGRRMFSPTEWKTKDHGVSKKGVRNETDGRMSASSISSEDSGSVSSDTSKKSVNKKVWSGGGEDRGVAIDTVTQSGSNGLKSVSKGDSLDKFYVERGINTDPLPHVESYRERYEEVSKEKRSLEDKLEVSEDSKVKMQNQHSLEMDTIEKRTREECRKENDRKIFLMEEKVREEKERASREKKEFNEQLKSYRNETKSLTEKILKSRKELQRKEEEKKEELLSLQRECEKLTKEKLSYEHSYQSLAEQHQRILQRACNAEIMVINTKKEFVMKPAMVKLQELEKMCNCAMQTVAGGEPELQQYKDQFKSMMDNYQNAVDEQVKKIQTGTELTQLEQIPVPTPSPISPSLKLKIQQVQRNMMLMQRKMLLQQQQQQMPSPMVPQLSLDPSGLTTGLPLMDSGFNQQLTSTSLGMGLGLPGSVLSTGLAPGVGGALADISSTPGFVPGSGMGVSGTTNTTNIPSTSEASISPASVPKKTEGKNTASFDYLVSLLSPQYPSYTREDFKAIITQLRKGGSLNGLPMDIIVKRVKELIEQKENNPFLTQQQQHVQQQLQQPTFPPLLSQAPSISQTSMPTSSLQMNVTQIPPLISMPDMPLSLSQMPFSAVPSMPNFNPSMFLQPQQQQQQPKQTLVPPKAPTPVISEVEYNDDNSCIICYEDMQEQNSLRLECGHRFHKNCIRSWLNEQNTCPTCRNHALLPDEYPHLKQAI